MQVKKAAVLGEIVLAAKKEFFMHGYENTSVRSIAAEAGISPGNIYKYFRSKKDLFEYITEPQFEKLKQMMERIDKTGQLISDEQTTASTLIYSIYKWTGAFEALYDDDTYIILGAGNGSGFEDICRELAEHIYTGIIRLAPRRSEYYDTERYPLAYYISRVIEDMKITAKRYSEAPKRRQILKNFFTAAILGFAIYLS